ILPVRVENVTLNKALRYYLSSAQWLDASTPPIEQHLQRLVEQLRARLGRPAAAAEGETAADAESAPRRDAGARKPPAERVHVAESASERVLKEADIEAARPAAEQWRRSAGDERQAPEEKPAAGGKFRSLVIFFWPA